MKKIDKNKIWYKNISIKGYSLNMKWLIILFISILVLSSLYIQLVKKLIYNNVYNNIAELTEQSATQLNLSITEQKKFVQIMVDFIDSGYLKNANQIFEHFEEDLDNYHFTRLVILNQEGNGITSDGHTVTNYPNIKEFFNTSDSVYLSENRPSTVSDYQVNIYSKTFSLDEQELVLMATIRTQDYKEILSRKLFGIGGTYLINNNGTVLIDSFDFIKESNVNLYDFLKNTYQISYDKDIQKIDNMAIDIKNHEVGTFNISSEHNTYFVHYEKVNINDWYVVTIAADNTIAKELFVLVIISLVLCLFISSIIIGISIYIDILNQKQKRKLYKTAYIDPITSLGNENYFKENGSLYLQEQIENKYILALDINKFKALNNIYSYEFCNDILKTLSQKLIQILPLDNITCRISNDVFATLFSYDQNIETLLKQLITHLSNLEINDTNININLSIGVYKITSDDNDINKVLNKAYTARSKIKGLYNENYYIFDEILENKLMEEQQIESCMEAALKNGEFKVVYQPKTSSYTEKTVGAEALVRWYKNGTVVSPDKFIPLFEKNKFIVKLDLYIFEQACKDIASWKENYHFTPIVSINVSKEHFVNENFIDEYVKITDKYQIDRSKIDLEITESATIDENIDIINILNSMKKQGFTVSIDDFGTGYSSLSMLQNMPIDIIKIDKVFVNKADLNSDKNIINYIMLIAKRLGVKTIVEGVETKEQVEFVKNLKCDVIQGYYYSKPISKEEFEVYFKEHH